MNINLIIALVVCLGFSGLSHAEDNHEKYVTVNGTEYTLVKDAPPETRPAYKGPSGLVWSNLIIEAQENEFDGVGQVEAEAICNQIQIENESARLPTKEELVSLRESMSSTPNPNSLKELETIGESTNNTYDRSKPALPNINSADWLWANPSSNNGSSGFPNDGFYIDVTFGVISSLPKTSALKVRCVWRK